MKRVIVLSLIAGFCGCSDDTSAPPPAPACRIDPSNIVFWSDNEYVNGQDLQGDFVRFGMELVTEPLVGKAAPTAVKSVTGHIDISTNGTPVGRWGVESYTFTAGTDSTDGDLIVWFEPVVRPDGGFHLTRAMHTELTISGVWNGRDCSARAQVDDNGPVWGW